MAAGGFGPARALARLNAHNARMTRSSREAIGSNTLVLRRPSPNDNHGPIQIRLALSPARRALRRRQRPGLQLEIEEPLGIDGPR
jgi:hypothetical protein